MTATNTNAPGSPGTSGTPGSPDASQPAKRVLRRTQVGVVVSDKRDKTRTVTVDYQVRHPKYGKYLKRQTRFQVHDENNESHAGDRVEIANCRPISKTKTWRLVRVMAQAPARLEHQTDVTPSQPAQA